MRSTGLRGWAIFVVLLFALPSPSQGPSKQPGPAKARVDLYGDPLPEHAVARLGTVRFRHAGAVHAVAFSDDGKLLAASSDDLNMVIIWNRSTGRRLTEVAVDGPGLPPTFLRFSPDGKRLYSSYWYGKDIRFYAWDVNTGADATDIPRAPSAGYALGYSSNGREVILLDKAELVRWDIEKGKELGRYNKPDGYLSAVTQVGPRLLVPQFDGQAVRIWDAAQNKQLWSIEATRHKNYPGLPMAFSEDGTLFAVEAPPQVISVYESVSGKRLRRLEADVGQIYYSVGISPDRRTVAGSNWDGSLRLWDVESGRERAKVPAIEGWATRIFFAPDSKTFATGGGNNAHGVLLWDTATGKRIDPFPGHASPISSVSFAPDSETVATSSSLRGDPVVRLWDPQTGRLLRSLETPNGGGVSMVTFSPDAKRLATCGWSGDRRVRIWDAGNGRELSALPGHDAGCTCVAFSPDAKRLASGDAHYNGSGHYEGRLRIWDAESGKLIRGIHGTRGAIQRVLFTSDGRQVLAAANGVHVYDANTGQLVDEPFQAQTRVWGLALSADGRLLATADGGGPVRLWELATRREIPLSVPGAKGYGVSLTPDGRTIAVGGADGAVLFHWPSGDTVGTLRGDAGTVTRVFFSPDGRRLATASNHGSSSLVWDVAGLVNRPLPEVAEPSKANLRRWWADLRDDSPEVAYRAIWRFAATPEQSLPYLSAVLRPVEAAPAAVVSRLINDLESPQFQVRDRASRELERFGEAAAGALQRAKKADIPVEQSRRIERLLAKLERPVPEPELLRASRAVAALEQMGAAHARKLLATLAAGAEGARLTWEAKASLERLDRGSLGP
jgi:WD40 repeat protein